MIETVREPSALRGSTYRVRDRSLTIATDDPHVERFVAGAYRQMRTERAIDPHHAGEIAIHAAEPRLVFDGSPVPWPRDAGTGREPFLRAFYGARELFRLAGRAATDCWSLYGAAVELNGRAVVVVGRSGVGKTTLTLELVARGARLYSDECVFVEKATMMVTGLPRSLMIREPSLKLLNVCGLAAACDGTPSETLETGRLWYAVDPQAVFHRDVAAAPARLTHFLSVDDARAARPSLIPLAPSVAAGEFARRLHGKFSGLRELRDASQLLSRAAAYRLQLGAPDASAALIASLCGT